MNQEYRERVKRHLDAGGDPKYVNVKKKAESRHKEFLADKSKSKALAKHKETKKEYTKRHGADLLKYETN